MYHPLFNQHVSSSSSSSSKQDAPLNAEIFAPINASDVPLDFKNLTADKIKQYTREIIEKCNQVYGEMVALKNNGAELSFNNLVQPEINLEIAMTNRACLCRNPSDFYTDQAVRDASTEATKELDRFVIEVKMRKDLYEVFERYYQSYYPREEARLTQEECRYVENVMRGYKAIGMHLPEQVRDEIKEVKSRISDLESDFAKNLNDDTTSFYFTREQLVGMPDSWFKDKEMNEKSQYKLTLDYPDIVPALEHLEDRELRKTLSIAVNARVSSSNQSIFNEVIKLRYQLSKLLGRESFAQVEIEDKMAKTPDNAMRFLNDLNQKITPLFDKDMNDLRDLAKKMTGDPNFQLECWDVSYYVRIYKENVSQLDQEELKKFFPIEVVTQGLFKIYERMLGLKFFEKETDNKWHESVKYFEVYDYDHVRRTQGNMVGGFYLDMFPRDGKYDHVAAFDFIHGYESNRLSVIKRNRLPLATMACNFPQSGGIRFDDVQTFFHEFGHIMHVLCSGRVQLPSMSAFNVEGDFVETPSQMLENWVYEPAALKLMSQHSDTKQPIDDATIQKIIDSRYVMEGYASKRQLVFAFFDMRIHLPPASGQRQIDTNEIYAQTHESLLGMRYPEGYCCPASFGHLMGGYGAGYYGYKWAEVNASDMFFEVFKKDPLSAEGGQHYRRTILNPGASKDGMDLLRDFLGREPSNDHYLQSLGIQKAGAASERKPRMFN